MNPTNSSTLTKALKLASLPILISLILTPIRFGLELLEVPEIYIFPIGLLWLTLGFAIYWGIKYHQEKNFYTLLALTLLFYSPISRIPVAFIWWIDKNWELNTHYGLFYNTFSEVLWNQVVYGSLVQGIPGFLIGALTVGIIRYRSQSKINSLQTKH